MADAVRRGEYARADVRLQELHREASQKDLVMDLMDRGTVSHLQGQYAASNRYLDAAKRELDRLFGVKISDELEAIAWNETSKSFKGEEFERVMLCLLTAFNYLHLGSLEEAAVEARQINQRLQVYADLLKKANLTPHYKQDPFAQYLAGLIEEAMGDANDAFRSYEDALRGYNDLRAWSGLGAPQALKAALYRVARILNYAEAIEKYSEYSTLPDADPGEWQGKAHLVVIVGVGTIAHKESREWMVLDPQGDVIKIPYPVFARGHFLTRDVSVEADGRPVRMEVAHDLSTLAINVLEDKNSQVKGKAVAKSITRYAAKKVTRAIAANTRNEKAQAAAVVANLFLNVADIVERADTRSWMTLPDHYRAGVASLEPSSGGTVVSMKALGTYGLGDQQILSIPIKAGETRFVVLRVREGGTLVASPPALPRDAVALAQVPVMRPRASPAASPATDVPTKVSPPPESIDLEKSTSTSVDPGPEPVDSENSASPAAEQRKEEEWPVH